MRSLLLSSLVASALLGCTYPKIVDRSMLDGGGESDGSNTDTMIQADASADADAAADGSSPDVVAVPDVVVDACVTNGAEVCDGRDNDCDGTVDDVDPATLSSNGMHCGRCGNACTAGAMCQRGFCTVYPSSGADGDFVATAGMTTVLDRARYEYRSFRIPAGATVVLAAGTGVVDIRVQGEVVIEGTLDASGGNGSAAQAAETAGLPYGCNGDFLERKGGGGGGVGGASAPAPNVVSGCAVAAIGNLPADMSGAGANGATGGAVCVGLGGRNGGGGSGSRDGSGGGGGGGAAGGGGGSSLNRATMMDMLAIGSGGIGGSIGMSMGGNGGAGSCTAMACTATGGSAGASPMPYRGTDGESATDMTAPFIAASGGGGGSIGVEAAADLALVRLTPGSSGGAGGSAGRTCNPYGHAYGAGGGGGGGGGAIRITTTTSIRVTGRIAANGGIGGNGGPDSQGGAGGGGSGGAIDLRAPTVTITTDAVIEARGGAGGRAMFAAGAGSTGGNGGAGGLGRIHIATDDPTTACNITASAVRIPFEGMNPCTPSAGAGTAGRVFVSRFSR